MSSLPATASTEGLLPKDELAEKLGCSTRTIERKQGDELAVAASVSSGNGKLKHFFNLQATEAGQGAEQRDGSALVPGVAAVNGLDAGQEEQAHAADVFRHFIEPIAFPDRHAELHARFPRRGQLTAHLAAENGVAPRTVQRYLARWEAGKEQR